MSGARLVRGRGAAAKLRGKRRRRTLRHELRGVAQVLVAVGVGAPRVRAPGGGESLGDLLAAGFGRGGRSVSGSCAVGAPVRASGLPAPVEADRR